MSIVKEGWLEKCGPKHCPTWNKRWMVLYDSRVIEYFSDEQKRNLKGIIELCGTETLVSTAEIGKSYEYSFNLATQNRIYRFAVANADDRKQWCHLLLQVIDGELRATKKKNRTLKSMCSMNIIHSSNSNDDHSESQQMNGRPHHRTKSAPIPLNSLLMSEEKDQSIDNCNVDEMLYLNNKSFDHLNDNCLLFRESTVLILIVECLFEDKFEFNKLFMICKSMRELLINHRPFFSAYSVHVYPSRILNNYSYTRNAEHPWILNHLYREIWIFGNVKHYEYRHLKKLRSYVGPVCNKLFMDDIMLWDVNEDEMSDVMSYVQSIDHYILHLHIRSMTSDSAMIESIPHLSLVISVHLDFCFHSKLFVDNHVIAEQLLQLHLHRVDLIADRSIDDMSLKVCFKQLNRLLVVSIIDCRWKHAIVLPPQLKILRFKPADLSILDMTRIADKNDVSHMLGYRLNWPLDMIVDHINWPSVMNQYIMQGHEALQNRKLRIWVLKHMKEWDHVLMNVNYCQKPPPLSLFHKAKCYSDLCKLDCIHNCSNSWTSKNTKLFTNS